MFWKKMGMMFKKGINRSNQYEDDVRFFQIFGFYFVFQFTMIIVQSAAAAIGVDVSSLYDISLIISAIYISLLVIGSVKFGMTLLRLLKGPKTGTGNMPPSADAKAKTWKKIRKVVMMLAFTVPGATLYMISLAVYLIAGLRGDVDTWLPMQYVFRFLECVIIWGLCSCLVHRKPGSGDKKTLSSQRSSTAGGASTGSSFQIRGFSGIRGGKEKSKKNVDKNITIVEESIAEGAIDEESIETHMV
ncbi:hypothetical protein TrST_g11759 [Triparma strigata]|uniref:Transmembrane protein n=1 Tax=Triparma strigata TaxID=1606541 RepID=A0A9W7B310_9STRA|nr:hypothetical protein TrST_g11759 [Triparma strigata]